MHQDDNTHEQLVAELNDLRQQVAAFQAREANQQTLEQTLRYRERELDALLGVKPQPIIARFDRQFRHLYIHSAIEVASGIPSASYIGKTSRDMRMPEPAITAWENALEEVFAKGLETTIEYSVTVRGDTRIYEAVIIPEYDLHHRMESVLTITRDVSHQKRAEAALSENFQILETVHHVGQVLAAELDLQKLVQVVTDTATELSRAEIGTFFYNVINEQGESYTLYTISGIPRTAFSHFPMPRNTEVFGPTFRGDGTIRIDDVHKDPRYGKSSPYYGMPKGHFPVVSYLAVPVISKTHEVLGGLFFGHSQPGIFTERDERVVEGLAAQAAIAMDNARLYEAASTTQTLLQSRVKLQSLISELGQKALISFDLPALMKKTGELLAQTLKIEYVKILEAQSDKDGLLLRAGFGWKEGCIGHVTVSSGHESQAGYTLLVEIPVIVANQANEDRFESSPLLTEHQVVSGISVIIEGHERHWGVLGIHSIHPRTFTTDDIYFVQSVANILGAAIERDRLDKVLENQRQWLSNVIATVPGVIWENRHTSDQEEMKLIFISAYVETLLGYTVEEALAEPHFWFKIFHPEHAQKTAEAFNRIRKSKGSGVINFRAIHKNGNVIDVQALMTTVLQDDKPIGKRGVMMDVTERQNLMQAQMHYAAMLHRSNEELRQFAYVASHDLQEPLRMVVSYLQLLEDRYSPKLDSDAHEFINFAVEGAKRMRALITALLEYSRVDGGEKDFAELNMELALRQALTNLTLKIEESHTQITYETLPTIKGDQAQIIQLFQNLIGNAIKFQKEAAPQIHISVERKDQVWEFGVRDNGIGIAPEYLERIFIIFQRLHKQDQYPGTGIGLAICKKVVERHGGRIWVESTVGRGTTFYFTIPNISD